jgi:hypothetical protein
MYLKPLNLLVFLVLCFLRIWWIRRPDHSRKTPKPAKPKRRRRLRPRTPNDCAQCRAETDQESKEPQRQVIPWSEVKSPRGRKKEIDTEGCQEPPEVGHPCAGHVGHSCAGHVGHFEQEDRVWENGGGVFEKVTRPCLKKWPTRVSKM